MAVDGSSFEFHLCFVEFALLRFLLFETSSTRESLVLFRLKICIENTNIRVCTDLDEKELEIL